MAGGNLLHDKNGNVLSSKHLPKNSTSHISLFWKLWLSLTIITFPLLDNKNKQNTNTKQPELNIQLGDLEQQKRTVSGRKIFEIYLRTAIAAQATNVAWRVKRSKSRRIAATDDTIIKQ